MVWGCFAAPEPGRLALTMNSAVYPKLLKKNVQPICLWPQAETNLGFAAGQWSKTHQQVHLLMIEEKQNEDFGVA